MSGAKDLRGKIGSFFSEGTDTPYQTVGDASLVENINRGATDPFLNQISQALFGTGVPGGGALGMGGAPDAFLGNADAYSQLAFGQTGAVQQGLLDQAQTISARAGQDTANQWASMNALRSGGFSDAFGEAVSRPFADALVSQQQGALGLAGQLLTGGQSMASNLTSNLLGQAGALSGQEWWQPDYQQQKTRGEQLMGALGLGVDFVAARGGK
jgi:hypothetical protein